MCLGKSKKGPPEQPKAVKPREEPESLLREGQSLTYATGLHQAQGDGESGNEGAGLHHTGLHAVCLPSPALAQL